jgi:hypothetical protein
MRQMAKTMFWQREKLLASLFQTRYPKVKKTFFKLIGQAQTVEQLTAIGSITTKVASPVALFANVFM